MGTARSLATFTVCLVALLATLSGQSAQAAIRYWDTSTASGHQGGNNPWDFSTNTWCTTTGGTTLIPWVNGNEARFRDGSASILTIGADTTIQATIVVGDVAGTSATIASGGANSLLELGTAQYPVNSYRTLTIGSGVGVVLPGDQSWILQNSGASITVNGDIGESAASKLTIVAASVGGSTYLYGLNTHSGGTQLNNGTLYVNTIKDDGQASSVGTGTLTLGISNVAVKLVYTGSGETNNRTIALNNTTGATTIDQSGTGLLKFDGAFTVTGLGSKTLTLEGSTAGTGEIATAIGDYDATRKTSLAKSGTGTWTLSGTNTYTGATNINGGILTFLKTAAKPSDSAVTVAAAGTLGLGVSASDAAYYTSADVDSLFAGTLTGVTMNEASGVAIDTTPGDFTYATNQSAARTFTKLGANTLTLSGANTYSGATNINAGALLVNGTHTGGGLYTVAPGASLGGTGSTASSVIINGTLAPGNSIESLATGTLTLNDLSTFAYELNSSAAPSVGADLQKVAGDLNLNGTVILTLDDLAATPITFAANTTFSLINYTGTWNGGKFTISGNTLDEDEQFTAGLNTWKINYTASAGGANFTGDYAGGSYVNISVVPEPGTLILLAMAAVGVLAYAWRKRK